nr:hypothetical protein [Tanacetum cinerariifolium]
MPSFASKPATCPPHHPQKNRRAAGAHGQRALPVHNPAPRRGLEAITQVLPPHLLRYRPAVLRALAALVLRRAHFSGRRLSARGHHARALGEFPRPVFQF